MSFIPLLVQAQPNKEQEQHPTQHTIPDSCFLINPQVEELLNKPNPICVVVSYVSTEQGRKFVRNILFSNNLAQMGQDPQNQLRSVNFKNEGILMYNKIQTGYNLQAEPVSWVYLEVDLNNQQNLSPIVSLVSCIVIYETQNIEIDRIFFEKTTKNFKELYGKNPIIFYLTYSDQIKPLQIINHFNCHQMCIGKSRNRVITNELKKINSMEELQYSSVSSLNQNKMYRSQLYSSLQFDEVSTFQNFVEISRKINRQLFVLQVQKKKPISAAVVLYILKKLNQQNSLGELNSSIQIYNSALKEVEKYLKLKSVKQYKQRIQKLYEDKKFISLKLLRNGHQLSAEVALKIVQKYMLPTINTQKEINLVSQIQKLLQEQLTLILQQVQQINMKWGKSFIDAQYCQIQSRLKNKELKQINSLKSQFCLFSQYFHKKVEGLGCKRLQAYFELFVIQKIFQCCNQIYQNQKKNIQSQLTQVKNRLLNSEKQSKQLKKQLSKQSGQSVKNMQDMNFQISNFKTRLQLLEQNIINLKLNIKQLQESSQSRQEQLKQEFSKQIQLIIQQKCSLQEQINTYKRSILSLQSQILKQTQMHKQTSSHYLTVVNDFKQKQKVLKEEIKQLEAKLTTQIEQMRRQNQKQLSQSKMNKSQKQKQGLRVQDELNQLNIKYRQLQNAFNNTQYQLSLVKANLKTQKTDLQLSLNICEQKLCEYESKQPRYQKLQSQLKNYESTIEQYMIKIKQAQKQSALLRQQNQFSVQKLKEVEEKYYQERTNGQQLKSSVEMLEQKVGKMNQVKVNEWVQTQYDHDNKFKTMLEEAINMVAILEKQYNVVKVQNAKLRYRLGY